MAREIRQFSATIPAGTLTAAPFTQDMSFPARVVDSVEIVVPSGENGFVGWRLENSGVPVIPYDSDEWIVASGENIAWPLDGYITSGSWQLTGYNTGTFDHTVYVRFLLSLPTAGTTGPLTTAAASSSLFASVLGMTSTSSTP